MLLFIIMHNGGDDCRNIQADKSFTWRRMNGAGDHFRARNITKVYPGGVVANHNVNLQIKKGEIHALVGENGAGKSTLMKMLFGMLAPTEGQIFVDGKEVHFSSSSDAIAAGLGMVHQPPMRVPSMTVAENLILGAEPGTALKVDRKSSADHDRTFRQIQSEGRGERKGRRHFSCHAPET